MPALATEHLARTLDFKGSLTTADSRIITAVDE